MFADGLVTEVEALCEQVGLRDGVTAPRAIDTHRSWTTSTARSGSTRRRRTFIGTRRYVRRQRSWFRRDHRITWLDGADPDLLSAALRVIDLD